MDVYAFQAKWRAATGSERALAQAHFLDLCALAGLPNHALGDGVAFERAVAKAGGGTGFADAWVRGRFAMEYKGRGADLDKAYAQLLQYKDALENPPLLIVSDLDRIVVHPNFTGVVGPPHLLTLERLHEDEQLRVLRAAFLDPELLRPGKTRAQVTEEAASRFGAIAAGLHARGEEPHRVAHALMQVLFCLFAEDAKVLPAGLFAELLAVGREDPASFAPEATALFTAMQTGGRFALKRIPHVNGGLFATVDIPRFTGQELATLEQAAGLDWGGIEPAIFGTLFERSLDPGKRAQLGAHYTGFADIERVVDPVVMVPLRRRWDQVRTEADALVAARDAATTPRTRANRTQALDALLAGFRAELAAVTVLDPACGSGNFLTVTLVKLLELEKAVAAYGALNGLPLAYPTVGPGQLLGLEVNAYARELAQVALGIAYLQWMRENGFGWQEPVLAPLETVRLQDALIDRSDPEHPTEATWPAAHFVVGNPPFLGGKRLRSELGDAYVDDLFAVYTGAVAREADLCCYFFEKARGMLEQGSAKRAGLLATNSIRGGANRAVLKRIKETGDIFMAWDDEPWVIEGAAVRIALVGFDDGAEQTKTLDGVPVAAINADLTGSLDITGAKRLPENAGVAFMGDTKGGPFDVPGDLARRWLALPANPNGRPNRDVVRPWVNGLDITRRPRDMWIVDFGVDMPVHEAALYEAPFEYARETVKPARDASRSTREWWLHERPRVEMRRGIEALSRFIVTPTVAKHRLFVWSDGTAIPDHQLIVFARADDYVFGVLHSRAHEVWSLRMGTWLGVGNDPRYTPTTCFETFPLPWPPGREPGEEDGRVRAIAAAARGLDRLRLNYLNPPDADAATLKIRTLTNLYNQRPTWLAHAHAALDRAVWAAYGWDDPDPAATPEETILTRLLVLNGERSRTSVAGRSLATG